MTELDRVRAINERTHFYGGGYVMPLPRTKEAKAAMTREERDLLALELRVERVKNRDRRRRCFA